MKRRTLGLVHGAFYVATGLWPLVSMRTFELASGPKKEKWLTKTMGVFIAAVGGALMLRPSAALGALAAGSLAACDVVYVTKGRIAKSYLLDAAVEMLLVFGWLFAARREEAEPELRAGVPRSALFTQPSAW